MTSFLTVEDLHFCDGKGSLFRSALLLALNSFHYLFTTEEDKYYEEGYVDTHTLTEDTGLAHSAARQENSDASPCKIDQKCKNGAQCDEPFPPPTKSGNAIMFSCIGKVQRGCDILLCAR